MIQALRRSERGARGRAMNRVDASGLNKRKTRYMASHLRRMEIAHKSTAHSVREPEAAQGNALRVIAVFKLIKALALIAAGLGVIGLLNSTWNASIVDVLHELALEHGRRRASAFAGRAASLLSSTSTRRLSEVAFGSFLYGGIFLVEAAGLWTRKRWAEYLTAIVTASLLPFEIGALMHRVTVERGMALLLNLAVVAYLGFHLWKQRRGRDVAKRSSGASS